MSEGKSNTIGNLQEKPVYDDSRSDEKLEDNKNQPFIDESLKNTGPVFEEIKDW